MLVDPTDPNNSDEKGKDAYDSISRCTIQL